MRQHFIFGTVAMAAIFLQACVKEVKQPSAQKGDAINTSQKMSAATGKPGSLTVISLRVTLSSDDIDAAGTLITSKINSEDGRVYTDGVDYVKAVIDQNGNFSFNTNTSKGLGKRFVVYDLSDPVDPSNTYFPMFARGYYNQYNYTFVTGSTANGTSPFKPLQQLLTGESEYVYMDGVINGDRVNSVFRYTVSFRGVLEDNTTTPTALALVKKISNTEWKIIPGSPAASNNVAALRTGDTRNEVFKGLYRLPFSFILSVK